MALRSRKYNRGKYTVKIGKKRRSKNTRKRKSTRRKTFKRKIIKSLTGGKLRKNTKKRLRIQRGG